MPRPMSPTRCLLCDRVLMVEAPEEAEGVTCTVCRTLPTEQRKRLLDAVVMRILDEN